MEFLHVNITRDDIVTAARSFKGMQYDAHHSIDGVSADCAGFMLQVCKRVGLLPADHTAGISASDGESRASILANLLHTNFAEIANADALPGDLLRFNFDGESGRHIAIKTSLLPTPHGSLIHCMNNRVNNTGGVYEQRIDAYTATFLMKAYRLKQWVQ